MALLGHLTPLHGGDSIPLTAPVLTVGRADICDVVIRHQSVSGRHCRLAWRDGTWVVEDLGSRNGTFVGRIQVEKVRVKSGVTVRIGSVRFELTAAPARSNAPVAAVDEDLAMELLGETLEPSSSTQAPTDRQTPQPASRQIVAGRPPVQDPRTDSTAASTVNRPATRQKPATGPQSQQSAVRTVAGSDQRLAGSLESLRGAAPACTVATAGRLPSEKSRPPVRRFLGKLTPKAGGDPIALMDENILIGRGRNCGIRVKDSIVSTEHCRLEFRDGYWCVCDLGSRNGIRINGQPTTEDWLMPGDVLAVAKFRFEIDYKPKSNEPPPAFDVTAGKSLLEKAGLMKELESGRDPKWLVTDQDPEPSSRVDLESL